MKDVQQFGMCSISNGFFGILHQSLFFMFIYSRYRPTFGVYSFLVYLTTLYIIQIICIALNNTIISE
jgi:hypothetical protein